MFNICMNNIVLELFVKEKKEERKVWKGIERNKGKERKMNKINIFMFGFLDLVKC